MNEDIKNLKGSEKRDVFKWAHKAKMENASFYASDADLVLAGTFPRGVIAYLDYKGSGEGITFTEQIVYDEWVISKPVYIIKGSDPENGPFVVSKYICGGSTEYECTLDDWEQFLKWEAMLRRDYSSRNGKSSTPSP